MKATLTRYLSRIFLTRVIAAALAFGVLLQILNLLDAASDVLARGVGIAGLARYAALQFPLLIAPTLPLAVLVAALLSLRSVARHQEIVAMRAAGIANYQLLAAMIPGVLAVAALQFVLNEQIAPRVERALIEWKFATDEKTGDREDRSAKPIWFRVDGTLVRADRIADSGRRIEGLDIYSLDTRGRLAGRIRAARARHDAAGWTLTGVERHVIADNTVAAGRLEELAWPTSLEPSNLTEIQTPPRNFAIRDLHAILQGRLVGARSPSFYETKLERLYVGPFALFVMVLLTIPVVRGAPRKSASLMLPGLSIGLGLLYILVDGMLIASGDAGVVPPFVAAWLATGIFASVGGTLLAYADG